jgi:hypothetical protein
VEEFEAKGGSDIECRDFRLAPVLEERGRGIEPCFPILSIVRLLVLTVRAFGSTGGIPVVKDRPALLEALVGENGDGSRCGGKEDKDSSSRFSIESFSTNPEIDKRSVDDRFETELSCLLINTLLLLGDRTRSSLAGADDLIFARSSNLSLFWVLTGLWLALQEPSGGNIFFKLPSSLFISSFVSFTEMVEPRVETLSPGSTELLAEKYPEPSELLAFFDLFRVCATSMERRRRCSALVEMPSFFASLWVLDVEPLRVALGCDTDPTECRPCCLLCPLFTNITTGSSSFM